MEIKKTKKLGIVMLIILWILTKPFKHFKYTNFTIGIINVYLILRTIFEFMYKSKKNKIFLMFKIAIDLVMIIVAFIFTISQILIYGSSYYSKKNFAYTEFDYVIVLGAGLRGKELSRSLKLRLDKALEIDDGKSYIIVSGGMGKTELITEAKAMREYLIANNIDKDRIISEEKATSTFENFKFSLELLKKRGLSLSGDTKFAIVTNDFHIFRSKYLLKSLGYSGVGVPAKSPKIIRIDYIFREFLSVMKSVYMNYKTRLKVK